VQEEAKGGKTSLLDQSSKRRNRSKKTSRKQVETKRVRECAQGNYRGSSSCEWVLTKNHREHNEL